MTTYPYGQHLNCVLSAANDQADLVITRVAVLVLVLAAPCLYLFAPDFGAVISLVKVHEE